MLVYISLGILMIISLMTHMLALGAKGILESNNEGKIQEHTKFHELQQRYNIVYFLATFADWLQGPYIYQVYSHYGYSEAQIALLYVTGFFSSMVFGTGVGVLADRFGRKRMCIAYSFLYAVSCLTKASPNFLLLLMGRVLGGICTSILFSTFEAWYIYEHVQNYNFLPELINLTFAKATFYNGILAIFSGIVSNVAAELCGWGPVAPFMIAIPVLVLGGFLTMYMWEENNISTLNTASFKRADLRVLFKVQNLLKLGFIQSLYESVMYTFVFLWTPVLEPLNPPLGFVFSCFMFCIMIGSSFYSYLIAKKYSSEKLLKISLAIAVVSFISLAVLMKMTLVSPLDMKMYAQLAYVVFLVYEVSVGMYFPAIGYLRSQIIPEEYRVCITNLYRVPMNLFTCLCLFRFKNVSHVGVEFILDTADCNYKAFITCSTLLVGAFFLGKMLKNNGNENRMNV